MAGDADMGFNEIIGRIATLEALVLKLCELEARKCGETGGTPALDGFVHSLVEAVAERTQGSPDLQKQFVSAHVEHLLRILSSLLKPDDRARN